MNTYTEVAERLDRLVRRRLKRDLKDEGAKMGRFEYEELVTFKCEELADRIFKEFGNA